MLIIYIIKISSRKFSNHPDFTHQKCHTAKTIWSWKLRFIHKFVVVFFSVAVEACCFRHNETGYSSLANPTAICKFCYKSKGSMTCLCGADHVRGILDVLANLGEFRDYSSVFAWISWIFSRFSNISMITMKIL